MNRNCSADVFESHLFFSILSPLRSVKTLSLKITRKLNIQGEKNHQKPTTKKATASP